MTVETDTPLAHLAFIEENGFPFDFKKTYYLAGPMSGYPEFNYPTFEYVCKVLRREEIEVASPHEIDYKESPERPRGSLTYQDYIDGGLELLSTCQGIILLPGWPQSTGAIIEVKFAVERNMPVYFYNQSVRDGFEEPSAELICMNRRPPA